MVGGYLSRSLSLLQTSRFKSFACAPTRREVEPLTYSRYKTLVWAKQMAGGVMTRPGAWGWAAAAMSNRPWLRGALTAPFRVRLRLSLKPAPTFMRSDRCIPAPRGSGGRRTHSANGKSDPGRRDGALRLSKPVHKFSLERERQYLLWCSPLWRTILPALLRAP